MELTFDWVTYREIFGHSQAESPQELPASSCAWVVVEKQIIREAYSPHDDLSEWLGSPLDEIVEREKNRDIVVYDRARLESALQKGLKEAHFPQQLKTMIDEASPVFPAGKTLAELSPASHFLIDALKSGWNRLLPSSYGIYVRLDHSSDGDARSADSARSKNAARAEVKPRDFLVLIRRGEVAGFHRPDLSYLSPERKQVPAHIVDYLSEKYLVPVQGIFTTTEVWNRLSRSATPWKDLAQSLKCEQSKLEPFRWSVTWMVATRAFLNL